MSSPSALIERMGFGLAQAKVLVGGGGTMLADGSELLLIGSVTRVLALEWDLDVWQKGMVVSVVFFGVLVGNLLSGPIGDRMGRRLPIILSYAGVLGFSLLSILSRGFVSMACLRFFVGVSFGIAGPAFNTLCGEMAPSGYRLQMNAWGGFFFAAGEFYSAFLVWMQDPMMEKLDWRWLIALGAIPAACFLLVALFILRESPSFLAVNGRHSEARRALEDMRIENNALDVDIDLVEPGAQRRLSNPIATNLGIIFGRHMIYTTCVVCISVFTLNFLFYGGLYAFPQALPDLKLHTSPSVNLMMGALVELPGCFLGVYVGNRFSRKTCMLVYLLMVLTSTLTFSIAGQQVLDRKLDTGLEIMLQCGLVGNKVFTAVGFLVVYVYTAEIYPTVARTTGGGICLAFGRCGAILAPTLYEKLVFVTGSHTSFFSFTAALCGINAILVLFLPYETQGIVLQDHPEEQRKLTGSSKLPTTIKMP